MVAGPLPTAGVSLVAQNLEQFKNQMREANEAVRQMGQEGRESANKWSKFTDGLHRTLSVVGGLTAGFAALRGAAELAALGAAARRADLALLAYAGSAEEAERATEMVSQAAGGALSRMEASQTAAKLFSMGLATTAEEAARLTRIAITLGTSMGRGPQEAFEQFTLLLANQSILRLDTFGLSGVQVRRRMEELAQQGIAPLDRQTRFLMATLELGDQRVAALEASGYQATTGMERLRASTQTLREEWGRRLEPILSTAAETLVLITTWGDRVNAAFQEQSTQVTRTATSYHDYLVQVLAAAVASGKLNQSEADQILTHAEGRSAIQEGTFAWSAWTRTVAHATEAGIIMDRTQWVVAHSTAAAAEATDDYGTRAGSAAGQLAMFRARAASASAVSRELSAAWAAMGDRRSEAWAQARAEAGEQWGLMGFEERFRAAQQAALDFAQAEGVVAMQGRDIHGAFGMVETGLAGMIQSFQTNMRWISGGGLGLQMAAQQVMEQAQQGVITPEEAETLLEPIHAAALGLQTEIGQISMSDAIAQQVDTYGGNWVTARDAIIAARENIEDIPAEVRTAIAVAVRWSITGGPGTGFQHGGVIPPGYPNDTFIARLSSGEVVLPAQAAPVTSYSYNYDNRSIGDVNMGGRGGRSRFDVDREIRDWFGA